MLEDRLIRGDAWTLVHNRVSGQHMRTNALARLVMHRLDGRTSVEEIVKQSAPIVNDEELEALAISLFALSEQSMISLGDANQDQSSEAARSSARLHKNRVCGTTRWLYAFRCTIRIAGWQQSRLSLKPLLCKRALFLCATVILVAIAMAMHQWSELLSQFARVRDTPDSWWHFALMYLLLKCAHECAHAIAIKHWGGDVHEIGITLLVLMPIPYVDATDMWRFAKRSQRILVGSAGMLIEALMAAVGLLIWLNVEPGLLGDFGFAAAITGSVSTVLFNANPLLKFDGYHIVQDALDIPNLASRASAYLRYLARRYLLQILSATGPGVAAGERRWLLIYGISATAYRWVITLGIALYLASRFPLLGGLLAIFALHQLIVRPACHFLRYLQTAQELCGRRTSVGASLLVCTTLVVLTLILVPVPTNTRAQGIVGVPMQAQIFAPESAEINEILVEQGQQVIIGQSILVLDAPLLHTRLATLRAKLSEIGAQYQSVLFSDVVAARALLHDRQQTNTQISQLEQRVAALTVRATVDGTINLDTINGRPGTFVQAGDVLGYVVNPENLLVKAVVSQSDISRVREGVNSVRIRLAERFSEPFDAALLQETPAATRNLPSQILAYDGLSGIAVASNEENQWMSVEPVFHLELSLPTNATAVGIGGRAYITMNHAAESIGQRSWRSMRQLLLDRLAI